MKLLLLPHVIAYCKTFSARLHGGAALNLGQEHAGPAGKPYGTRGGVRLGDVGGALSFCTVGCLQGLTQALRQSPLVTLQASK